MKLYHNHIYTTEKLYKYPQIKKHFYTLRRLWFYYSKSVFSILTLTKQTGACMSIINVENKYIDKKKSMSQKILNVNVYCKIIFLKWIENIIYTFLDASRKYQQK